MQLDTRPGQSAYRPWTLSLYDWFVLGLSCSYAWRCPARTMLSRYDALVGARHLDVGVGSGYFLDRCHFPPGVELHLADLNEDSLRYAARRVSRYAPRTHTLDVMREVDLPGPFDSIGLGFLLHCLPGGMSEKAVVFRNLAPLLGPDGVLFGTTILGDAAEHNGLGRRLMRVYNERGIFTNRSDGIDGLEAALRESFGDVRTEMVGVVAFYEARTRVAPAG